MANILVVDDDLMQCRSIENLLKGEGHTIYIASNGHEGLQLFHQYDIKLVISDIVMPEMEGMEFIRSLLRIDPMLPIIVMSGNVIGKDFLDIACKLGAQAKIAKPIQRSQLMVSINQLLET